MNRKELEEQVKQKQAAERARRKLKQKPTVNQEKAREIVGGLDGNEGQEALEQGARWHNRSGTAVHSAKAEAFINDLVEVFKKHNLALAHEDRHGSFLIDDLHDGNVEWLRDASIETLSLTDDEHDSD